MRRPVVVAVLERDRLSLAIARNVLANVPVTVLMSCNLLIPHGRGSLPWRPLRYALRGRGQPRQRLESALQTRSRSLPVSYSIGLGFMPTKC